MSQSRAKPTPTLDGCRAKLDRARDFLDELGEREREFMAEGHPYEIRQGESVEEGGELWTLWRCHITRPLPSEWGLIAGDAVHNMRSALDHLAHQLVLLNNKTPSNNTAFPVYDKRPTEQRTRQRFQAMIKLMRRDHQEAIKKLQPFQRTPGADADLLTAVSDLDNMDKHRVIPPLMGFLHPDIEQAVVQSSHRVEIEWIEGPLEEGRVVARVRFIDRPPVGAYSMGLPLGFSIRYGIENVGLPSLIDARETIVGIVESFGLEFPK